MRVESLLDMRCDAQEFMPIQGRFLKKRKLIWYNNVQIVLQRFQSRQVLMSMPSCLMMFDLYSEANQGMDFVIEVVEGVLWGNVE